MSNDSLIYKTERPWPNKRLKTGAIVGHTTETTSRIWVRTGALGHCCLLVWPFGDPACERWSRTLKSIPFRIATAPRSMQKYVFQAKDYSSDTTHVFDVTGLEPGVRYQYALCAPDPGIKSRQSQQRILLGHDYPKTFRTMPPGDDPFTFAFFSCHMPYEATLFNRTRIVNMNTWEALHQALRRHDDYGELRFVLAAGDQVYADGVPTLSIWELLKNRMQKSGSTLLPSKNDMVSWYRDIYRGYWGFAPLQQVHASYPTYMIWDDHEIGDGWGSFRRGEIGRQIPRKRDWTAAERRVLASRMFDAARQVYHEYEHAHNPPTPRGRYDYSFRCGTTAVYVLDGRGHRDLNRGSYKILGEEQFGRFAKWLGRLDPADTKFLFVVSAVPLLHLSAWARDFGKLAKSLQDDLRDSWDHPEHTEERAAFTAALFGVANRGIRVSVLSGDVHAAAAFRIEDKNTRKAIYQLTSSAITYNVPRVSGWVLAAAALGRGETEEGHPFERVALYRESNFAMVQVDPIHDRAEFRLYGQGQSSEQPDREWAVPEQTTSKAKPRERMWDHKPGAHSIATIPLDFG